MHVDARVGAAGDIGRHSVDHKGTAQEPGHDRVNQRVVEQIEELVAFVGQIPAFLISGDSLVIIRAESGYQLTTHVDLVDHHL